MTKPGAMTVTMSGEKRTPSSETATRRIDSAVKTMSARSSASFRERFLRYSVKTGTKETVSDPSARRRRRRFWDPEGDEEGVRREPRTEQAGHDHVPEETEDAGEHRRHPYDARRPDDPRIFGTVPIRHIKISWKGYVTEPR